MRLADVFRPVLAKSSMTAAETIGAKFLRGMVYSDNSTHYGRATIRPAECIQEIAWIRKFGVVHG